MERKRWQRSRKCKGGRGRDGASRYRNDIKPDDNSVEADEKKKLWNVMSVNLSNTCRVIVLIRSINHNPQVLVQEKKNSKRFTLLFLRLMNMYLKVYRNRLAWHYFTVVYKNCSCQKIVNRLLHDSLTDADRKTLEYGEYLSKFRFGDRKEVLSETSVKIPAYLANQKINDKHQYCKNWNTLVTWSPSNEKKRK